ncbi:MAG: AMP-binding protein [Enhygromyxa sp.]
MLLHEQVAAQIVERPTAVAIRMGDRTWTYTQLGACVQSMVRHLAVAGVGRGAHVVIALQRSPEFVVAMLATLELGAVCVPLDPDYPRARAEAMLATLRRAAPMWLLSRPTLRSRFVAVDGDWIEQPKLETLSREAVDDGDEPGRVPAGPDDIAFILFTSGTSGSPKGVLMTHAGRCGRQDWTQANYPARVGERHLCKSPIGFSTMIREVFWPLSTGGELVLARAGAHRLPPLLVRDLLDWEIAIVNLVPSILQAAIEEPGFPRSALRRVICTGEVLGPALRRRFFERSEASLTMFYGATEVPTAAAWEFDRHAPDDVITIGRASDQELLIVDDEGRCIPRDSTLVGEIWISGTGLARGYLGEPELTARAFVAHPNSAGQRAYRTGDRGRFLADGRVAYLGRCSAEVQVGAQRIDLLEVEALLERHGSLRSAVVIPRENPGGQVCDLVAYVVLARGEIVPTPEQLREFLRPSLPGPAIPVAFVVLLEFPRDAHGKLARRELPPPRRRDFTSRQLDRAEASEAARMLCRVCAEVVLGSEPSPDDRFSDLGGSSLAALRVVRRLQERHRISLPPARLLGCETLGEIAGQLSELAESPATPVADPLDVVSLACPTKARAAIEIELEARDPALQVDAILACASPQWRCWYEHRFRPHSSAWSIGAVHALEGLAQPERLAAAWRELCRRHPPLRTVFAEHDGRLYQVVLAVDQVELEIVDMPASSPDSLAGWLDEITRERLRCDLDEARSRPASLCLLCCAGEPVALLLATHQLVCDGWSRQLIHRELGLLYEQGPTAPGLGPAGDYAGEQALEQCWLASAAGHAAIAAWADHLRDAGPATRLPRDRLAPAASQREPDRAPLAASRSLWLDDSAHLRAGASGRGCGLAALVAAGLALALARWTRRAEVLIGLISVGRPRVSSETVIGAFINVLPLRVRVDETRAAGAYLADVAREIDRALELGRVPLDQIVAASGRGGRALFDVVLNVIAVPRHPLVIDGRPLAPIASPERTPHYGLEFYVHERSQALELELRFDPRRNSSAMIEAFIAQVAGYCRVLVDRLHSASTLARLGPAPFTSKTRSAQRVPPDEPTAIAAVAAYARAEPERLAIELDGDSGVERWTYATLFEQVERVAAGLRGVGLGAGETVAIIGPPSLGLVVSALAVLRARGCLLLLEPETPAPRVLELCRLARAQRVVIVGDQATGADGLTELERIELETLELDAPGDQPLDWPTPHADAYVTFTSGSTGTPRPVRGTHRSLAHLLAWQRREFAIGSEDRVALTNRPGFDPFLRDLLLPLSNGASLHIPPWSIPAHPSRALAWLARARITVLHLTPTLAQLWLLGGARRLADLRWALFAGEPLTPELIGRWRDEVSDSADVVNLYGATEATMVQSFARVTDTATRGWCPVGRAIPGFEISVERAARTCGVGEIGEVVVSSSLLSRYGDDAGPGGFDGPGRYRTGDLGRWRDDGQLELFGRRDTQLNIGGARIEPGEVEAHASQHPGVRVAIVGAWGSGLNCKLGLCWVAEPSAPPPKARALRAFLAARLPGHMVPTTYVEAAELPRTPGGKVDRKAVARALEAASTRRGPRPPRSNDPRDPTELRLLALWRELLGPEVGVEDDFFDAGGSSLLAAQLVARIEAEFGCTFAIQNLFPRATVRELARALELGDADPQACCVLFHARGDRPALACLHPAGGSALCYLGLAAHLLGDRPVYGIEAEPLSAQTVLRSHTIEEMASRYAAALVGALARGPVHLLGYSLGGIVGWELGRQLLASGFPVASLTLLDSTLPGTNRSPDEGGVIGALGRLLENHDLDVRLRPKAEHALWADMLELARIHFEGADSRADGAARSSGRFGAIQQLFRRLGLLPRGGNLDHARLQLYLGQLREHFRAARGYRPGPLECPVIYVSASSRRAAAGTTQAADARSMGPWRELAVAGLEEIVVESSHLELMSEPALTRVMTMLRPRFERLDPPTRACSTTLT